MEGIDTNKEISRVDAELKKLKNKKDKLLDLYSDDLITKEEFKEKNIQLSSDITNLEDELKTLTNQNKDLDSNVKQLKKIKDYFSIEDSQNISDELVYELSTTIIDKIYVETIKNEKYEKEANIMICPMFGERENISIYKDRNVWTIGNISKKMIEAQERQMAGK
jgi:DNA repair exonuclease SbcCD ATPase subunit